MFCKCAGLVVSLCIVTITVPAGAHETDQFTVPPDREFAELGPTLTRWAYRAVESGVTRTNNKIRDAVKGKRPEETIKKLQAAEEVAMAVNAAFPPALFAIEDWDKRVQSPGARANFPGRVVGYKPFIGVRRHAEFSLDPFRAWNCATIKAYGVYLGTDKLGHFTDMGKHYYREYRKSLGEGKDEERATRSAIKLGSDGPLFFSETGFLGEKTAGAYSNADLVANYMGMLFYRNVTDEVMLQGRQVPPMLVRDGPYWRISDRVRPDSDFFALFISDHFDEALNPSRYVERLRDKIRKGIREHDSETIDRYVDAHGNRRSQAYFAQRQGELSTYWGVDYGHKGDEKTLLTIANTCFPGARPDMKPGDRDRFGLTALHHAARDGDPERLRALLGQEGADVNAGVRSRERRSPEWGSTPLHYAVRDGRLEAVKALITGGADVNAANDRGVRPLHRAIHHAEIARLLVAARAEVGAIDERGETPLHWAALDGTPEAMTALLQANASVTAADHQGRTPLHVAAACANEASVKLLLGGKANVKAADRFGVTPLHLASRSGSESIAAALLDAGAEPDARDGFGVAPLHEAIRGDAAGVVARLLAANADPAVADAYGATPLHVAARVGAADAARLLLGAGADATARAGSRGSPVDVARRANHRTVLALLRGASNATDAAETAASVQAP